MAGTRSSEPGNLSICSGWNLHKTGRLDGVVLRVYLSTAAELTMLHMGAWSWSNLTSGFDNFEPIVVRAPFGGFRVAVF